MSTSAAGLPTAPIVLDGAMGTELARRGVAVHGPLAAAQALIDAPELVAAIHRDYLEAGAQVLRTNSFGLHARSLAAVGLAAEAPRLYGRALELLAAVREQVRARDRELAKFRIAAAVPPLAPAALGGRRSQERDGALDQAEYRALATGLLEAGADLVLLETFGRLVDIEAALAGVADLGAPVWLAVVLRRGPGPGAAQLLDGGSMVALRERVRGRVDALFVNCTAIDEMPAAIAALPQAAPRAVLGIYPHLGKRRHDGVWIDRIVGPEVYAEQIHAWLRARPRLTVAGSCCGSTPAYTAALRRWLHPDAATRAAAFVRLAELVP